MRIQVSIRLGKGNIKIAHCKRKPIESIQQNRSRRSVEPSTPLEHKKIISYTCDRSLNIITAANPGSGLTAYLGSCRTVVNHKKIQHSELRVVGIVTGGSERNYVCSISNHTYTKTEAIQRRIICTISCHKFITK